MMNRLVVEVCDELLDGAEVGTFCVTVSDKPFAGCDADCNSALKMSRITRNVIEQIGWSVTALSRQSGAEG